MGGSLSRSYRIAARAAALKLAGGVPATGPAGGPSSAASGPPSNCAGVERGRKRTTRPRQVANGASVHVPSRSLDTLSSRQHNVSPVVQAAGEPGLTAEDRRRLLQFAIRSLRWKTHRRRLQYCLIHSGRGYCHVIFEASTQDRFEVRARLADMFWAAVRRARVVR